MSEIFRAFTLFHDKILLNHCNNDTMSNLEKDYHVIGYFDWFQTESFPLTENGKASLEGLFLYNLVLNETNSEYQSFQNIFGFRNDFDNRDKKFWSDSLETPIYYILFIQLEEYKDQCYDTIEEILTNEYNTSQINTDNFILYYTLDKNDFIVCFKSNSYKKIMDIINSLYTNLLQKSINIIYSYTNLIIKNDKSNSPLSGMDNISETIDSICIKTILNNYNVETIDIPQKIDLYCKKLSNVFFPSRGEYEITKKNIVGYEILGDTDCRFIARDVPLNILLKCFLKNGVLSRYDNDFNYCFVSSMTSLNKIYGNYNKDYSKVNKDNRTLKNNSNKKEIIKEKIRKISESLGEEYRPIVTLLHQITNYIIFSGYQIEQYEYDIMMEPITVLLDIILNNSNRLTDENEVGNDEAVNSLYEYLNNIYSILQENTRTDIRFYGISDYSMMSYYSPTKLRAFYSIIVNKTAKHYAGMSKLDNSINYAFLIFFTYSQYTYVDQLWKNRLGEDKLMMVKISEKDFYNIRDLVFQLAHEVAHFVGNEDIRKRVNRFDIILRFIFYKVYRFLENRLPLYLKDSLCDIDNDKLYHTFYDDHFISIKYAIEKYIDALVSRNLIEKEYVFYYMDNVENHITELLFDWKVLHNFFEDYYEYLINLLRAKLLNSKIDLGKAQRIISNLYDFKKEILYNINCYKSTDFIGDGLDYNYIKELMNESYADMSAVLLFDLSVTEFLDFILKRIDTSFNYSDSDKIQKLIDENVLFQRCSIVIKAFSEVQNDKQSKKAKTFADFVKSNHNGQGKADNIYNIIVSVLACIDAKFDHPARYVCDYIKGCIQAYYNNNISKVQKEMRRIYDNISDKDTINIIKYINKYVAGKNTILSQNSNS